MCFFIHPKHPKMKTAKRDIPCYKEGFHYRKEFFYPKHFTNYQYDLGQLNKIEGKWPIQWRGWSVVEIYEGFHSYSNKKELYGSFANVKCIIPKGAHYFYNPERREYVSDQIIVQEFI